MWISVKAKRSRDVCKPLADILLFQGSIHSFEEILRSSSKRKLLSEVSKFVDESLCISLPNDLPICVPPIPVQEYTYLNMSIDDWAKHSKSKIKVLKDTYMELEISSDTCEMGVFSKDPHFEFDCFRFKETSESTYQMTNLPSSYEDSKSTFLFKEEDLQICRSSRVQLNPRWVEILMGLPIGWTQPNSTVLGYLRTVPLESNAQPSQRAIGSKRLWPTPRASQRGDSLGFYIKRTATLKAKNTGESLTFSPMLQVEAEASVKGIDIKREVKELRDKGYTDEQIEYLVSQLIPYPTK